MTPTADDMARTFDVAEKALNKALDALAEDSSDAATEAIAHVILAERQAAVDDFMTEMLARCVEEDIKAFGE